MAPEAEIDKYCQKREKEKTMKSNYHTHSIFCDGKNTPEEIVLSAIEKGFHSIGFSGHGYTEFDLRYCMKDVEGYRKEINRLKGKYAEKIEIYLGSEEDAFRPVDRSKFDYIIGSSHYIHKDGKFYPIDSSMEYFQTCLSLFDGDFIRLAHAYYGTFCEYILKRKPDIVGHFDLITKYIEKDPFLFGDVKEYDAVAAKYLERVADSGCLFEVNTGAIARGARTTPYPAENLLHILKKKGAGLVLSADSHAKETLDFAFEETVARLKELGFSHTFVLRGGKFVKEFL